MTAMALRLFNMQAPRQCRYCPTILPSDGRELCYFHSRPSSPRSLPETRLQHLASHLREQDRPFLPLLVEALTMEEIAERMGPGWTRRQVEHSWQAIRLRLGLEGGGKSSLERLAILRIAAGMDACICGR